MARGRPITGNSAKSVRMEIRLEPEEAASYDELANADGLSRSEWMRGVCNEEVRRASEAPGAKQPTTEKGAIKDKKSRAGKDIS